MSWTKQDRADAIEQLRAMLKPGDKVYTNVEHVSRSGMSRVISAYVVRDGEIRRISHLVAKATDRALDRDRMGVKVGGCGMDMTFELVYTLGRVLFPDGFKVPKGERGRNGDTSGHDNDGGYALNRSNL
jgi:hypothetical protein